jgi:hypothetical protein
MTPLRSFLKEMKEAPKVKQALASGIPIDGKPVSQHLLDVEALFDELERNSSAVAVAVHDELVAIVTADAPLKERVQAWFTCLLAHARLQ